MPSTRKDFPRELRPVCLECRHTYAVNDAVDHSQSNYWVCPRTPGRCGYSIMAHDTRRVIRETIKADYPAELRPECLGCRKVMMLGGSRSARRWVCSPHRCNYTILIWGRGYGPQEEISELAALPGEEYLISLERLALHVYTLARRSPKVAFAHELEVFKKKIDFQLHRSPEHDRKAVAREVDRGIVTPEELAETIPLPVSDIEFICKQLVKDSKGKGAREGYEFRPIGPKLRHGAQPKGIFRKDAPALVHNIVKRPRGNYSLTPVQFEGVEAFDEIGKKIREHEAQGRKGKRLPWETEGEFARRKANGKQSWIPAGRGVASG